MKIHLDHVSPRSVNKHATQESIHDVPCFFHAEDGVVGLDLMRREKVAEGGLLYP